jgi:hypothetical protein
MLECVGNSTDAFVTVQMPNMLPVTTVVMHLQWHMYTNKYILHSIKLGGQFWKPSMTS